MAHAKVLPFIELFHKPLSCGNSYEPIGGAAAPLAPPIYSIPVRL